jgi:hypothetical protein
MDLIPPWVREWAPEEAWWLLLLIVALAVLLVAGHITRGMFRILFARRRKERDWDKGYREDLEDCPLPVQPPNERALAVYHLPVRVRLVVVAALGKELEVDVADVPGMLNRVFPELGTVVAREEPRIRVWPAQLSEPGFVSAFHRRTLKPKPDGEPSHWVLLAGRATVGKQTLLLGLALWSEQPSAIGRLCLQPHQWLDILRLRLTGEPQPVEPQPVPPRR